MPLQRSSPVALTTRGAALNNQLRGQINLPQQQQPKICLQAPSYARVALASSQLHCRWPPTSKGAYSTLVQRQHQRTKHNAAWPPSSPKYNLPFSRRPRWLS
mmetsp:Transcript_12116/g.18282  ORF Transcript_12116/g.18282 Transcript_12116/m.18282 type:complete len:102 (-) Transcript_12116:595-900(-)